MKQANKLILAVTCYALAAVLVLGGSLYALADPALSGQTPDTPDDPEHSASIPTTEEEIITRPPLTAEIQNTMLIENNAFTTPENKYRALRIEHHFQNIRGESLCR